MQPMRDLMRDCLGRSLRDLSDADRLAAAWPVACGPALAGHGELLHLDEDRVLHVRVDSPAWMPQFLHVRSALAGDLGRIARVRIASIRFIDSTSPAARRPVAPR